MLMDALEKTCTIKSTKQTCTYKITSPNSSLISTSTSPHCKLGYYLSKLIRNNSTVTKNYLIYGTLLKGITSLILNHRIMNKDELALSIHLGSEMIKICNLLQLSRRSLRNRHPRAMLSCR